MNNIASIYNNLSKKEKSEVIERIIHLRKRLLRYTQAEFAKKLKVSQAIISLIEAGKKPLNVSLMESILEAFNVNPDWLFFGSSCNVFGNESSLKYEANEFIEWYRSLPLREQVMLSRTIRGLSEIFSNYPPGS